MPEQGVCAIVLAAGQGSRYRATGGADKLLAASLAAASSPPVLAATLESLRGIAERLLVVTRADNLPLHEWLSINAADCEVLALETRGLGHSLAQAIAYAPAARGWLVALADMPYVQPRTLREVAAAIDEGSLVVPTYHGRPGHPRGIGRAHRGALLQLDGDRGAQMLFAANPVLELAVDDPGVLQDIDHPDDRRSH